MILKLSSVYCYNFLSNWQRGIKILARAGAQHFLWNAYAFTVIQLQLTRYLWEGRHCFEHRRYHQTNSLLSLLRLRGERWCREAKTSNQARQATCRPRTECRSLGQGWPERASLGTASLGENTQHLEVEDFVASMVSLEVLGLVDVLSNSFWKPMLKGVMWGQEQAV